MKRVIKFAVLGLLLLWSVLLSACSQSINLSNSTKNIALIVKMNNGYHWGAVKMGADAAAGEFNVNVRYNAPDGEDDIEGQIKLVNSELDQKVDALILAASDYKALVEVTERAYDMHIPVIIIDSEVNTGKITSYIATDNLNAGVKAGGKLVEIAGGENAGDFQVAIMSFVKGTRNAEQREEGLLSVLDKYSGFKVVAKEYCSSDTRLAYSLTVKMLKNNPGIRAIVALNAIASEGVAEAVDQQGLAGKVKIIAFDNTPKEIDYMEKGVIQAIITQNPFSMGYLGVKYAVDALHGKPVRKFYDTESKVIDEENMYLRENQRLLFPFVK